MAPDGGRQMSRLKDDGTDGPDHAPAGGHHHESDGAPDHDHVRGHDNVHPTGLLGRLKELYQPHSHDAVDSIDTALESSARGIRATKIGLAGLLATALMQVVVVWITGSVALLADTIHNFADGLTSIPLWIAFVLGRRAASTGYTYGFRRAEDLSGLFIVAMIAFSAVLVGWESINRLINPEPITNIGLVALAGIIGFMGNELVAMYRIRIGRQIGSAALIADGHHARTDGLTSLAVLLGAGGVALGFPAADPIVGLLITVVILFVLRDAARQVFRRLMDGVDPDLVAAIRSRAEVVAGVRRIDGVRVRWIGHRLHATLDIAVDPDLSVADGHRIADEVTYALFSHVGKLEDVVVHVDPYGHDHRHDVDNHITRVAHSESGAQ
jgi:cation diffusion facilitator family transporter